MVLHLNGVPFLFGGGDTDVDNILFDWNKILNENCHGEEACLTERACRTKQSHNGFNNNGEFASLNNAPISRVLYCFWNARHAALQQRKIRP